MELLSYIELFTHFKKKKKKKKKLMKTMLKKVSE